MRLLSGLLVVAFLMIFAACTPTSPDAEDTEEVVQATDSGEAIEIEPLEESAADEPTAAPTNPPLPTETPNPGFPAIELLAAPGLGCSHDPATDESLLFNALYFSMSSEYDIRERLFDEQGEMLFEAIQTGSEQSGPEVYILTPDAYEVSEGTALTLELVVSPAGIENAPFTSRSTLIYNCSTGQTIENRFERAGR